MSYGRDSLAGLSGLAASLVRLRHSLGTRHSPPTPDLLPLLLPPPRLSGLASRHRAWFRPVPDEARLLESVNDSLFFI